MIATSELESAVRAAIPVQHLEIIDQSSGCGENYAILVVSEVSSLQVVKHGAEGTDRHHACRHSRARQPWRDIDTVTGQATLFHLTGPLIFNHSQRAAQGSDRPDARLQPGASSSA